MGHNLGNNYGKLYSFLSKPVLLDLNFIVDSANGNGLGVRSVKGQGVQNVYMHTSASAAPGNPNPAAGYCLIQLEYNYNKAYAGPLNIVSPLSGSNVAIGGSSLTVHNPYVITSVGSSTLADWQAVGVPKGVEPAAGVSFIAQAVGAGSGSGQVQAPSVSGISHSEIIGDTRLSLAPVPMGGSPFVGGWVMLQFLAPTPSASAMDFPYVATAPADGSVISMTLYLEQATPVGGNNE